jgi:adenylate cyclase
VVFDLAGYTALTEAHGDHIAAEAASDFFRAIRVQLRAHHAQEVKTLGDGMLVRVERPADAIALARRVVTDYGERNLKLGVRAGIDTGSAVERQGDWFGHAVNVAARVADLAEAGEVALTDSTRQVVPDEAVRSLGPQRLKNVPRPVEVFVVAPNRELPALPVDPVCRMAVAPDYAYARRVIDGQEFFLCSRECAEAFAADPGSYIA